MNTKGLNQVDKKERIVARFAPCNCGCKGQDPRHAKSYRRMIRNRKSSCGVATVQGLGDMEYSQTGTASLPMEDAASTVVVRLAVSGCWVIDRNQLKYDRI